VNIHERVLRDGHKALQGLLLGLTIALGLALAWQGGFSIDDEFERRTIEANAAAVSAFFDGSDPGFAALNAYGDRYYGVGFHALSAPLRGAVAPLYENFQGLDRRDALIGAGHVAVFLFALLGGFGFYRILRLLHARARFARWATLFFLANPYVLGHATMNVKDAPFMVAWILCTWRLLVPCERLLGDGSVRRRDFFWLGLCTALLLSIRVSGLLVAVEYGAAAAGLAVLARQALWTRRAALLSGAAIAMVTALLLVWLAYPVLWLAPWKFIDAVAYMSHHPWGGCTWTWDECLPAQNLPWWYVPSWLGVKVSMVGWLGVVAGLPMLWRRRREKQWLFATGVLLVSIIGIFLALVAMRANLYNEIRQVLFLVPMVYLLAFAALSGCRTIGTAVLLAGIAVAALDHVALFPYPYAWFNEAARFTDVGEHFETDYWMLSTREMAGLLPAMRMPAGLCAFTPYPQQMRPFVRDTAATCVNSSLLLPRDEPRPFLLYTVPHFVGGHYDDVAGCRTVYPLRRQLALAPQAMELAAWRVCL